MMYKERKKLQRKVNKYVKAVNENIYNDPLWKGRFKVSQKAAYYFPFEDCRGGWLRVKLNIVDKKTGKEKVDYLEMHTSAYPTPFFSSDIFGFVNDFIIEDSGVWEEDPRPTYENTIDFREPKARKTISPYKLYSLNK